MKPTLSAVVIVKDAEMTLARCLESVAFADEIVVLDSGSGDATPEIARRFTTKFHVLPDWPGFGIQKNRVLDLAAGDWVLSIDADEWVTPELRAEIEAAGFKARVADEARDFRRRFQDRVRPELREIAVLPERLDRAADAVARLEYRDGNARSLEVKGRGQPRDARTDDRDRLHRNLRKLQNTGGTGVPPVWRLSIAAKPAPHTGETPMPPEESIAIATLGDGAGFIRSSSNASARPPGRACCRSTSRCCG